MPAETSLDKALAVLEAVARSGGCRLTDLCQTAGYPPATVHRILALWAKHGYVRQDPGTKRYLLGLRCLDVFARVQTGVLITAPARPVMQRLMETTGEAVNLVVFENEEAVYVEQVANRKALLRMFTRVGARVPLHTSGVGKAYLATLPHDDLVAYFRRVTVVRRTRNTLTREADFLRDIEAVRARGYAVDREEFEEGVGCIASVVTHGAAVAGAVSISGPSTRLFGRREGRLARAVLASAKEISRKLGA